MRKLTFLLLLAVFIALTMPSINALTLAHNQTMTSDGSDATPTGMKFVFNSGCPSYNITTMTKHASEGSTKAKIYNGTASGQTLLTSCTFAGSTCTLSAPFTVYPNIPYRIVYDSDGSSRTRYAKQSITLPLVETYANWSHQSYWTGAAWNEATGVGYAFYSIVTVTFDCNTAPPPPASTDNFYISAQNAYNSSFLESFNATVGGVTYGTTNGKLNVTAILKNSTTLFNITLSKPGYLNKTLINVNVSADLNGTISISQLNITATDLFTGAAITSFNVTVGLKTNTTTNGVAVLDVNDGTFTIYASSGSYLLNTTSVTVAATSSQAASISLWKGLNVYALNNLNSVPIQNFSVTLRGLNYSRTVTAASSANTSFFKVTEEWFNLSITAPGYAPTSVITNSSGLSTSYTFRLYTTNSFNITFKDEATLLVINGTLIRLDLISDIYANNYSTSTGALYIDALTPAIYNFRYYAAGYSPRLSTFTLTNNTYNEITLLLLTGGENVSLYVYDESNNPVEGAQIKIYRYSTASNSYILINTINTDFEGKAISNLQKNAEFYRFYIYYEGTLRLATTPAYVSGDQLVFTINTGGALLEHYFKTFNQYTYSLTYNPETAAFRYYYDTNGEASQGCLYLYTYTTTAGEVEVSHTCTAATSGTILILSPNVTNTYYIAKGTVTISGADDILITMNWQENASGLSGNFGLFMTMILFIIFAFIGFTIGGIKGAFVLSPVSLIISSSIGIFAIPVGASIAIEVVGIALAVIVSRSE